MFWAILLTIVICGLLFLALVFRAELLNTRAENNRLFQSNRRLTCLLREHRNFEIERRVRDSYCRGLYDGRETDTAYRELLRRCKDGNYDTIAYERLQREKAGDRK